MKNYIKNVKQPMTPYMEVGFNKGVETQKLQHLNTTRVFRSHTHIHIFCLEQTIYHRGVQEFCWDNQITLRKHTNTATCNFTGDKHIFVNIKNNNDLDKVRGYEVQNIIFHGSLHFDRDNYARHTIMARLRNR